VPRRKFDAVKLEREPKCDEILVHEILAAVIQRRLKTMGECGQFARSYLAAGYHREVTNASTVLRAGARTVL
jgi:hypothetical protein